MQQTRLALRHERYALADQWLQVVEDITACRNAGMSAEVFAGELIDAAAGGNSLARLAVRTYAA